MKNYEGNLRAWRQRQGHANDPPRSVRRAQDLSEESPSQIAARFTEEAKRRGIAIGAVVEIIGGERRKVRGFDSRGQVVLEGKRGTFNPNVLTVIKK